MMDGCLSTIRRRSVAPSTVPAVHPSMEWNPGRHQPDNARDRDGSSEKKERECQLAAIGSRAASPGLATKPSPARLRDK